MPRRARVYVRRKQILGQRFEAGDNAALADPRFKARLTEWGASALAGSPADFSKLIAVETEKWGKVIRTANIKAE